MNLRLPFDNKGLHIGYDWRPTYGDLAKKWSPVGSVLVSDNWDTGIGRIGLLGAFSYSRLFTRSDGVRVSNFQTRDGTYSQQQCSGAAVWHLPLALAVGHGCDQRLSADYSRSGSGQPVLRHGACGRGRLRRLRRYVAMRRSAVSSRPGSRPQTPRHCGRRAVAKHRSARSPDRPVPKLARATKSGGSTRSRRRLRPFRIQYVSRRLPAERQRSGAGGRGRECRINSSGQFVFGNNGRGSGYNPTPGASYPELSI